MSRRPPKAASPTTAIACEMRARKAARRSRLEAAFEGQLRALQVPPPVIEHRFHPDRRWRFDFAWPDLLVAVEIEGGVWTGGRHTRGAGFTADAAKYNAAAALGWIVLRFPGPEVRSWEAARMTKQLVERITKERMSAGPAVRA